jgi:hypothetical protein
MNNKQVFNNPEAVYHVLCGSITPTERRRKIQEAQSVNRDSKRVPSGYKVECYRYTDFTTLRCIVLSCCSLWDGHFIPYREGNTVFWNVPTCSLVEMY